MHDLEDRVGRYIVRIADGLVLVLSMLLAIWIHQRLTHVVPALQALAPTEDFLVVFVLIVPTWFFASAWTHADEVLVQLPRLRRVVGDLIRTQVISATVLLAVLYFAKVLVNRGVIAIYLATTLVALTSVRLALVAFGRHRNRHRQGKSRVLIVGADAPSRHVRSELSTKANPPSLIPPPLDAEQSMVSVLGKTLHETAVDRVVFTAPYTSINECRELVELCEERGVAAVFAIPKDDTLERSPRVVNFHGTPAIVYFPDEKRSLGLAVKTVVDTLASALGLVVLGPFLLLIALLLLLTDGRPVFFVQDRVGLRGRHFRMLKFRTMVKDADARKAELDAQNETGGPAFKLTRDPRVTRLGRLLRRSSADELPQLLNVLAGDMSLVGPRPLPVDEQQRIHGPLRRRLAMKPGITGLWQVSGRSDTTFEDWMRYDLDYVDRWSLWLDFRILLRTVPTVLFGKGAR